MIVIDPDAVHDHSTVMVVLQATTVTRSAVVHPRKLVAGASMAVFKLSVVLHFVVNYTIGRKIVVIQKGVQRVKENGLTCQLGGGVRIIYIHYFLEILLLKHQLIMQT